MVVWDDHEAFQVDIAPSVYEEGGGYNWKVDTKANIRAGDVYIGKIRRSDVTGSKKEGKFMSITLKLVSRSPATGDEFVVFEHNKRLGIIRNNPKEDAWEIFRQGASWLGWKQFYSPTGKSSAIRALQKANQESEQETKTQQVRRGTRMARSRRRTKERSQRRPEALSIKLKQVEKADPSTGGFALYQVLDGREALIGYLRKGKNTSTDTFPWQAFDAQRGQKGKLLGSFYGAGGKAKAIKAVQGT